MEASVIEAAIAAVGAVLVAIIGVLAARYNGEKQRGKEKQNQVDRAKLEMEWQSAALSFEDFLAEWADIHQDVLGLFENTNIDRFLLLRAWNGFDDPRWTTAFFQLRKGQQEPFSYVHFELDEDYVKRIQAIKSRGEIHFKVDEIPDSAIKRVYMMEGVKASSWFFISDKELNGTDCRAITYCSFSSHDAKALTLSERTRCQLIVGKLQRMADNTNNRMTGMGN